jgi:hypothetical protein
LPALARAAHPIDIKIALTGGEPAATPAIADTGMAIVEARGIAAARLLIGQQPIANINAPSPARVAPSEHEEK